MEIITDDISPDNCAPATEIQRHTISEPEVADSYSKNGQTQEDLFIYNYLDLHSSLGITHSPQYLPAIWEEPKLYTTLSCWSYKLQRTIDSTMTGQTGLKDKIRKEELPEKLVHLSKSSC